ncbi:MAG TPA: Trp biosynthesis-associated membrane protein [Acidimicrobiia bacterium]
MRGIGRLLLLGGAAGVIGAAFLPWVTVSGAPIDLDLLRVNLSGVGKTVSGTDTAAWPAVVGVGGVIAVLALFNLARKLILLLGLLVTLAGAGLVYYVMNVVDIETSGNAIKETLAGALVSSTAEPGPFLLLASGIVILVGAILNR